MASEGPLRHGDYRMARIGAALALTGVLVLMLLMDVLVPDYDVDPAVLVVMVTAICTLLGVEFVDVIHGKGQKP